MSDEPRGTRGLTYLWLIASVVGIVAGGIVWLAGSHDAADAVWAVTTAVGLVPLAWTTVVGLIEREAGVDLIALLAMAGSLALGEYLAGAVIAVMLASGRALETYADRPGPSRALRAARPRAADGHAIRGRRTGGSPDRRRAAGGSVVREDGRGRSGRRRADVSRGVRRVGPHRRVPPIGAAGWRPDPIRRGERGIRRRPPSREHGSREHVCRHRASGHGSGEAEGAVRAGRGPLCGDLHTRHAGDRRRRLAVVRRPGASAERAGGRHALPVDPGGPDRGGGGDISSGPARDHREGRWGARDARAREGAAVRQDRHVDGGHPAGGRRRGVR